MKCCRLAGALLLVSACTETSLLPVEDVAPLRDDRMRVSGQFCTPAPTPEEFPVRILFVADISQSMTITDPPPVVCPTAACLSRRGQAVEFHRECVSCWQWRHVRPHHVLE